MGSGTATQNVLGRRVDQFAGRPRSRADMSGRRSHADKAGHTQLVVGGGEVILNNAVATLAQEVVK
jgi:hypothetical protein